MRLASLGFGSARYGFLIIPSAWSVEDRHGMAWWGVVWCGKLRSFIAAEQFQFELGHWKFLQ